ncbi:unnamed protein product, partial [Citrullus colocynthis]
VRFFLVASVRGFFPSSKVHSWREMPKLSCSLVVRRLDAFPSLPAFFGPTQEASIISIKKVKYQRKRPSNHLGSTDETSYFPAANAPM